MWHFSQYFSVIQRSFWWKNVLHTEVSTAGLKNICNNTNLHFYHPPDLCKEGRAEAAHKRFSTMRLPRAKQREPTSMCRSGVALRPLKASLQSASCANESHHTLVDQLRWTRADFPNASLIQNNKQRPLTILQTQKGRNTMALLPPLQGGAGEVPDAL